MPTTTAPAGTNLALVVGTLRRPPELRPLPSGEAVLGLELTVRSDGGPAESVPIAWYAPAAGAADWCPGEELLVAGRTRQRFFRVGGQTQSRAEVVATAVVPTRRAAAARRALAAALEPWCAGAPGDPR
jgi:single-stranded DNA-binding protein